MPAANRSRHHEKLIALRLLSHSNGSAAEPAQGCLLVVMIVVGCGRGRSADQGQISPERIKELVELLGSKNGDTGMGFDLRVAAAEQLGEIGPRAKEFGADPALQKLLKHKDPKIKLAARQALDKINTPH